MEPEQSQKISARRMNPSRKYPLRVRAYSPASSKLAKEYKAILNQIGEQCAHKIQVLLKQYLRFNIEVYWRGIVAVLFKDFVAALHSPCCIHILRSNIFQNYCLFVQEIQTISALVERVLGGALSGKAIPVDFTNIDNAIIARLTMMVLDEIRQSLHKIVDIPWHIDRHEVNPMLAAVIPDKENVIVMNFEIKGDLPHGVIRLCLTELDISAYLDRYKKRMAISVNKMQNSTLQRHLQQSSLSVSVRLGEIALSYQELLNITVGDIIKLEQPVNSPVFLYVEDTCKFIGRIGKNGSNWAFAIEASPKGGGNQC